MNTSGISTHPSLILIRGLPGSGKSYLATALQTAIGRDKTVMLDPDGSDYDSPAYHKLVTELTAQGVDKKFYPYRFLRAQAHAGIEADKVIIWNQPFTHLDGFNKTVINLRGHAAEHHKPLPLLVVEVSIAAELAKSRVDHRKQAGGHGPSEATFDRFNTDYVSFANQGYHTVAVQGDAALEDSVATVLSAWRALPLDA